MNEPLIFTSALFAFTMIAVGLALTFLAFHNKTHQGPVSKRKRQPAFVTWLDDLTAALQPSDLKPAFVKARPQVRRDR